MGNSNGCCENGVGSAGVTFGTPTFGQLAVRTIARGSFPASTRLPDVGKRSSGYDALSSHVPRTTKADWQPVLTAWGNCENGIPAFFDANAIAGGGLTNAYTEWPNGFTRAVEGTGRR